MDQLLNEFASGGLYDWSRASPSGRISSRLRAASTLFGADWLIAADLLRTLPAADGRSQDRRPFLIVQQRVDVIHERDVLAQLLRDRVQRGLDGSVACSGKAGNDELRFLLSCLSLARHVNGLASRRTAGRR